jgi:hypothetical protein
MLQHFCSYLHPEFVAQGLVRAHEHIQLGGRVVLQLVLALHKQIGNPFLEPLLPLDRKWFRAPAHAFLQLVRPMVAEHCSSYEHKPLATLLRL